MLTRGVYPRMDAGALDKIFIPITNDIQVVQYVSALTQAILDKEYTIRERTHAIHNAIYNELIDNGNDQLFEFKNPNIHEVFNRGRLDAAIYSYDYRKSIALVQNYKHGYQTPEQAGFNITPGPSLEIKLLRVRLDSDSPKPGFYSLVLPTNISEYGTLRKIDYMGTPKSLPLLKHGDIVFGEAGFKKGRSLVLLDEGIEQQKFTTNAHGLYARRSDGDVFKSIFFRCVFDWYRSMGIIDLMAVGGNGGHFSPEYFPYLSIPKFPDDLQTNIVRLYHNPDALLPNNPLTLENFVEWHRTWNLSLGIWELDREMKVLQNTLSEVQDLIIQGKTVRLPFA